MQIVSSHHMRDLKNDIELFVQSEELNNFHKEIRLKTFQKIRNRKYLHWVWTSGIRQYRGILKR